MQRHSAYESHQFFENRWTRRIRDIINVMAKRLVLELKVMQRLTITLSTAIIGAPLPKPRINVVQNQAEVKSTPEFGANKNFRLLLGTMHRLV